MMDKWNEAKSKYEDIEIPEELSTVIQNEINKDKQAQKQKKSFRHFGVTAAACAILFVGAVNSSSTVAMAMYQVPVVGDVARLVTFRDYKYSDNLIDMEIQTPKVENTGNEELEHRINEEIQNKIKELTEEEMTETDNRRILADETNTPEEDLYQSGFQVTYEKKFCDGNKLSFILIRTQTAADSMEELFPYNVDLKSGKDITLEDLLGNHYKQIIDKEVTAQIKERMSTDETQIFFGSEEDKELGIEGFTGINENQKFYLNEKGNVVIFFDRFEIAPGYMGTPTFEIPYSKK